ncbi:MAG: SRPBCC family protein [candidate division Zixibacteria bacterium]|nr:SRPBCC family protein [candidate division Zixibacteria bacterium]
MLERTQLVKKPLEEVFAFFERPENLSKITPSSLGFEILTPEPIAMQTGAIIDYTVKPLGTRLHWRTLITNYEPPYKFVDVQLKGPYKFWHHTHTFEQTVEGTLITDRVRYILPFGFLGRLAHGLLVKRQLEYIFDYRRRIIEKYFSEDGRKG